jgi:hypothetical protein
MVAYGGAMGIGRFGLAVAALLLLGAGVLLALSMPPRSSAINLTQAEAALPLLTAGPQQDAGDGVVDADAAEPDAAEADAAERDAAEADAATPDAAEPDAAEPVTTEPVTTIGGTGAVVLLAVLGVLIRAFVVTRRRPGSAP